VVLILIQGYWIVTNCQFIYLVNNGSYDLAASVLIVYVVQVNFLCLWIPWRSEQTASSKRR